VRDAGCARRRTGAGGALRHPDVAKDSSQFILPYT
jgi:hypothetical protein